ncbi:MAG: hypothetical protein HYY06_17390, partial [Deltaproteobacteria bacterium]|nr:hypothetical protein [Deltaproteobacteria bacterium]
DTGGTDAGTGGDTGGTDAGTGGDTGGTDAGTGGDTGRDQKNGDRGRRAHGDGGRWYRKGAPASQAYDVPAVGGGCRVADGAGAGSGLLLVLAALLPVALRRRG